MTMDAGSNGGTWIQLGFAAVISALSGFFVADRRVTAVAGKLTALENEVKRDREETKEHRADIKERHDKLDKAFESMATAHRVAMAKVTDEMFNIRMLALGSATTAQIDNMHADLKRAIQEDRG